MTEHAQKNTEESDGYYHAHVRMTLDLCLSMNAGHVAEDSLGTDNPLYDEGMPPETTQAYQELIRRVMADPHSRLRLLASMALEEAYRLYYNEDDILTELQEDGEPVPDLVTEEGSRVELHDIAEPHVEEGAAYQWLDTSGPELQFTFDAAEGDRLDDDPLHNALTYAVAHLSFQEIPPDD